MNKFLAITITQHKFDSSFLKLYYYSNTGWKADIIRLKPYLKNRIEMTTCGLYAYSFVHGKSDREMKIMFFISLSRNDN